MTRNKTYLVFVLFFLILSGISLKKIFISVFQSKKIYLSIKNTNTAQKYLISEIGVLEFNSKSKKIIKNNYSASLIFKA